MRDPHHSVLQSPRPQITDTSNVLHKTCLTLNEHHSQPSTPNIYVHNATCLPLNTPVLPPTHPPMPRHESAPHHLLFQSPQQRILVTRSVGMPAAHRMRGAMRPTHAQQQGARGETLENTETVRLTCAGSREDDNLRHARPTTVPRTISMQRTTNTHCTAICTVLLAVHSVP